LQADRALGEMAVRALAAGHALRATARIVQVDKETVWAWLDRGARHCRRVMLALWHHWHVLACQRDAFWRCVPTKEAPLPGAKIDCAPYGDAWGWGAFAPVWRLVLAFVIGQRNQASAAWLLARVAPVTDDDIPFFTRDQWPEYAHAWLTTSGAWDQPERHGPCGAYPKPRRRPLPGLVQAPLVKKRRQGRVVEVGTPVVCDTHDAVAACLATSPVSQTVPPSGVERDHLTQRQSHRRLIRRTHAFAKDLMGLEKQWWVSRAYYHRVLPHRR